jgi:beta-glucosidase
VADILLGRAEPSGRLPVSLPRSVGQAPVYASPRAGGTKAMFSGSYTDAPATPLFPFGHGLSYTSFEYGPLTVRSGDTSEEIHATAEVSNTGLRAGVEVVQLYVSDRFASVARPGRQLAGFARVSLEPGERCRVSFTVHPSRLAFYDPEMRFVVEPGAFGFGVASSALNVRQQSLVELNGAITEYAQRKVIATVAAVEHLPPAAQEESAARLVTGGMAPPAPDGPAPAPANGTGARERSTR